MRTTSNRLLGQNSLLVAITVGMSLAVLAGSANAASGVAQGFTTSDSSIVAGTLVDLGVDSANRVKKATSDQALHLVGIVSDKPLVVIGDNTQKVQVVTSGITQALVSDINGSIKAGDKITASPLSGTGMKAKTATTIVGTAIDDLVSSNAKTETIEDKEGKSTEVHVGHIALQVGVAYYAGTSDKLSGFVPSVLTNLGASIAGKTVSPLRILFSFACLVIGFIVIGVMLQAAVRSGIISIGRNPLAYDMVRHGLIDVLATAFGILALTIILFYLILTA